MAIPIAVPRLGWSTEEALFTGWLKEDGAPVRAGEPLYVLETDKASQEVECLDVGTLRILPGGPKAGDKVLVGALIGYLLQVGEAEPSYAPPAVSAPEGKPAPAVVAASAAPASERNRIAISPRALRIAAEFGVDWTRIEGSGRDGRIVERDVRAALERGVKPAAGSVRRVIAERLSRSARTTVPVTLVTTVDASRLAGLRRQLKESEGPDAPGYTDLVVKLAAEALRRHPALNARWEGDGVVLQEGIHIGVAVDTEAGLLVPVIRNVPDLTVSQVAAASRDLAERARRRALRLEEMQGGTFTVSNLGAFGIDAFTPVINLPECAVLGMGRIERRPVAEGDDIVVREQLTLSLTFDHRIVDGAPAARFLGELAALIHEPGPPLGL